MPTKERKQREQEKKALQQKMDAKLPLPLPAHLTPFAGDGNNEFGRLPGGGLTHCVGDEIFTHPNIGKGGNLTRQTIRREDAEALKRRYKSIWGKRGAAKRIALDNDLNERTVQQYFKDFP